MAKEAEEAEPESEPKARARSGLPAERTPTVVSVLALVVAIIALVLVVVAGPGPIMTQASMGGTFTIGSTCTHYTGAEARISVPGPGTIVVGATVGVGINHTFGVADVAQIVVAASMTECTINNHTAFVSVPPTLPTDRFHFQTVSILRTFRVGAAGTYAFYVNGVMTSGADAMDRFDSASLVAVYYP